MKKLLALVLAVAMMLIPLTAFAEPYVEPEYHGDYEVKVEYVNAADEYVVVCRALNVRATASTAKAPIEVIHRGDVVKVVEFVGNWAKISFNDTEAYVYAKYIEKA